MEESLFVQFISLEMSRIGKSPIKFNDKTKLTLEGNKVIVSGPKGEMSIDVDPSIEVKIDNDNKEVVFARQNDLPQTRAYHGLYRSLVNNMVSGVNECYEKNLEIHGVGFRAKLVGKDLEFSLGYNHPILFHAPDGIEFVVDKEVDIKVKGIDKQLVGQTAANIRELKKPEPYKGKGIRYKDEYVRRKVGKAMSK